MKEILSLQILMVFVIFCLSFSGFTLPIYFSSQNYNVLNSDAFKIVKSYATGIILGVAFDHLLVDGIEQLSEFSDFPISLTLVMTGVFITLVIEHATMQLMFVAEGALPEDLLVDENRCTELPIADHNTNVRSISMTQQSNPSFLHTHSHTHAHLLMHTDHSHTRTRSLSNSRSLSTSSPSHPTLHPPYSPPPHASSNSLHAALLLEGVTDDLSFPVPFAETSVDSSSSPPLSPPLSPPSSPPSSSSTVVSSPLHSTYEPPSPRSTLTHRQPISSSPTSSSPPPSPTHSHHSHSPITTTTTTSPLSPSPSSPQIVIISKNETHSSLSSHSHLKEEHNNHNHNHHHNEEEIIETDEERTARTRKALTKSVILELSVAVHSIIIGYDAGLMKTGDETTLKILLVAFCFHQFFEGISLGTSISESGLPVPSFSSFSSFSRIFSSLEHIALPFLCIFFSLSLATGIFIGLGTGSGVAGSETSIFVQGCANSIAGGSLIYTCLIEMMGEDFSDPILIARPRLKSAMFLALFCGCASMALIAIWS